MKKIKMSTGAMALIGASMMIYAAVNGHKESKRFKLEEMPEIPEVIEPQAMPKAE